MATFPAAGWLVFQERFEFPALAIGVDERIIDGFGPAIGFVAGPGTAAATEFTFVTLYFRRGRRLTG
jgi:hypothetical protein